MTTIHKRGRIAVAGILAAAALGSAAPAQADKADRCEAQLERIEQRFRQIEERRGYEAASQVVERPRLAQVLRALRGALAMAITDIDEQKLEAVRRPRRDRGRRRAQRGARDPRRRARPLPRDGRRPAGHGRRSWPRAPAPRSATCASGSTPRPRAASSSTTRAAAYVLPPEHALVLADETSPFSMTGTLPGRERRRRGPRAPAPSASSTATASAGTSTTTTCGTAPSARSRSPTARTSWPSGCRRSTASSTKLEAGALVADVGCGHGASTILMAQAFPASRFVGIDYHADSIATARERAARGRASPTA